MLHTSIHTQLLLLNLLNLQIQNQTITPHPHDTVTLSPYYITTDTQYFTFNITQAFFRNIDFSMFALTSEHQ